MPKASRSVYEGERGTLKSSGPREGIVGGLVDQVGEQAAQPERFSGKVLDLSLSESSAKP